MDLSLELSDFKVTPCIDHNAEAYTQNHEPVSFVGDSFCLVTKLIEAYIVPYIQSTWQMCMYCLAQTTEKINEKLEDSIIVGKR